MSHDSYNDREGDEHDKVPYSLCRKWSMDLFVGLEFLHAHSILHRDIKPANLLLHIDETTAVVSLKISDFGGSRKISASDCAAPASLTPERCTAIYSAPELWSKKYGTGVDMWSAGAVLAEVLTGVQLFGAAERNAVIAKVCERIGLPLEDELPSLCPVVRALLPTTCSQQNLFSGSVRSVGSIPAHGAAILPKLLRWNPNMRLSATEALAQPYFEALAPGLDKRRENSRGLAGHAGSQADEGIPLCRMPGADAQLPRGQGPESGTEQGAGPSSTKVVAEEQKEDTPPSQSGSNAGQQQATGDTPPPPLPSAGSASRHRRQVEGDQLRPATHTQCQCSGHCMQPGHRYARGCSALVLLPPNESGPKKVLCPACTCVVVDCVQQRREKGVCCNHGKQVQRLSESLQLTWQFRDVCQRLTPCDMAVLHEVWESVRDDGILQTLAFVLKEPTAVVELRRLIPSLPGGPGGFSAQQLLDLVLRPLVMHMNGRVVRVEHDNLNGQGDIGVGGWAGAGGGDLRCRAKFSQACLLAD